MVIVSIFHPLEMCQRKRIRILWLLPFSSFFGIQIIRKTTTKISNWTEAYFRNCPNSFILIIIRERRENVLQNWNEWDESMLGFWEIFWWRKKFIIQDEEKQKIKCQQAYPNANSWITQNQKPLYGCLVQRHSTHDERSNGLWPDKYMWMNGWSERMEERETERESIFAGCRSEPIRIH